MTGQPRKELTLFDSTCLIVGIIIGAGIYETAPTVAASMGSALGTLAVWLAGGLLALSGAFCYAELATAYPRAGGDYVYLGRAYGPWAGYLFGWSQLAIIRPVDIALMAFVFGRYASTLYAPVEHSLVLYAALAVGALTLINIIGVKEGKWTQNILTLLKATGLLAVVVVGLMAPVPEATAEAPGLTSGGLQLALILVLFTFGGWNEMAYVAAEVRQGERNIARALFLGTTTVTLLYVLVNAAFLHALGYTGMTGSQAVAVDTAATLLPRYAGKAIAILICLSALGAVNGLVLTGARISYAMGKDHATFRALGQWHGKSGTPVRALLLQGAVSLAVVLVAGSFIDTILYAAPLVWLFFLATGVSLPVLRRKDDCVQRPYRVPLYPLPALVFCACCLFMFYSSVTYALANKPMALVVLGGVMLAGLPFMRARRVER